MNINRSLPIYISACILYATSLSAYAQVELTIRMTPTITLNGPSGEYQIQRAQVIGTATNWVTITNVILSGNPVVFYDSTVGNSQQYYKAVQKITPIPDNPDPKFWVWIPPGTFMMGSPSTEMDRDSREGPQTKVTISKGFWMWKYELTQKEYQAVMESNPSYWKDENLPVEQVTWNDATNYCGKLTAQEQSAGRLPAGYIYRLPTEAEWEYACRAGTTTRFSYGDDLNYLSLENYAWYYANSRAETHLVGQKLPNPWGLYDMHGNVSEWCLDWWLDSLPGGNVTDPKGPISGSYRVGLGGTHSIYGRDCRSASRLSRASNSKYGDVGFRPVLAPPL